MKNIKKDAYPTGDIIKDFPSYPDNYQDHRKYIYQLSKSKLLSHRRNRPLVLSLYLQMCKIYSPILLM